MASTFALQDDYGWLTIDVNTGVITAQSTDLISGRFDVTIIETTPEGDINHTIDIAIYGDNNSLSLQINGNPIVTTDHGVQKQSTQLDGYFKITNSPTSTYWKWLCFYREKYGSVPMDVVVINDETGVVTQTISNDAIHQYNSGVPYKRSDEWVMYINGAENITYDRVLTKFDPSDDSVTFDAVTLDTRLGGEAGDITIAPLDRELYIIGTSSGYLHVGKVDTSTDTFTYVTQVGNTLRSTPRALDIAVGQDYIYTVVGREPNVEVYQTTFDGLTTTLVASTTDSLGDIDLKQYRWGVRADFTGVIGYTDGYYYLYNDTITVASNLDVGPWTNQDGLYELIGSEAPVSLDAPYPDLWSSGVTSEGVATIQVVNDFIPIEYTYNVAVYPYPLINVLSSTPTSILCASSNYGGIIDYDTNLSIVKSENVQSTSRTRMLKLSTNDILTSGYPSQIVYMKNPNEITDSFLGYAGGDNSDSRGHYTQGMCEYTDGLVYLSGVQYRVGDSGTIAWFNPYDFDNTVGGLNDTTYAPLLDYALNNCVVVGTKIIVSSYIVGAVTEALVFIFDPATKAFTSSHSLGTDIVTTGHIIKVSDTDIFGFTALPDAEKTVIIYRMNVETGAILYKHTMSFLRSLQVQTTFQVAAITLIKNIDGYIYTTAYSDGSAFYLIRIDPSIGGVEALGTISAEQQLCLNNDSLFFATTAGNLLEKQQTTLVDVMPKAVKALGSESMPDWDFSTDSGAWGLSLGWSINTSLNQLEYVDGGTTYQVSPYALEVGKKYRYIIEILTLTGGDGAINIKCGGVYMWTRGVGVHTMDTVASEAYIQLNTEAGMNVTFNIVSAKELIQIL